MSETAANNLSAHIAFVVTHDAKLGWGQICQGNEQCFASHGLQCLTSSPGGPSRCLCPKESPIRINFSGTAGCVRPKAMYESCISSQECSHNNSNVKCVDFLCFCPVPFVLTADLKCRSVHPSTTNIVIASAPSAILFVTLLVLGVMYVHQRLCKTRRKLNQAETILSEASVEQEDTDWNFDRLSTESPTIAFMQSANRIPLPSTVSSAATVTVASDKEAPDFSQTRINRRFLRAFEQCLQYREARLRGLPNMFPDSGDVDTTLPSQHHSAPTCLFKEYTTVSEVSTELGTTLQVNRHRSEPPRPRGERDHSPQFQDVTRLADNVSDGWTSRLTTQKSHQVTRQAAQSASNFDTQLESDDAGQGLKLRFPSNDQEQDRPKLPSIAKRHGLLRLPSVNKNTSARMQRTNEQHRLVQISQVVGKPNNAFINEYSETEPNEPSDDSFMREAKVMMTENVTFSTQADAADRNKI